MAFFLVELHLRELLSVLMITSRAGMSGSSAQGEAYACPIAS
jgi:hypothetical protein